MNVDAQIDLLSVHYIDIKQGWNMISLSCYENIDKTDIWIRNNSVDSTWDDAVTEGIILGLLYDWDRENQNYKNPLFVDTLEPGRGYWLQANYDCELIVYSDAVGSGDITYLNKNWSLIGLPYDTTIDKENLIIHYNVTDYNWTQATTNDNEEEEPLILRFIYGWDTSSQFYTFRNGLVPGYGYWMFAYHECTLKRLV